MAFLPCDARDVSRPGAESDDRGRDERTAEQGVGSIADLARRPRGGWSPASGSRQRPQRNPGHGRNSLASLEPIKRLPQLPSAKEVFPMPLSPQPTRRLLPALIACAQRVRPHQGRERGVRRDGRWQVRARRNHPCQSGPGEVGPADLWLHRFRTVHPHHLRRPPPNGHQRQGRALRRPAR